jgi:methyl-accepting chemotaxis protein
MLSTWRSQSCCTTGLAPIALNTQCRLLRPVTSAIGDLTDLVDHRTKEMVRIFTHISTLVGTKFTDGEELQRLHKRFQEMSEDLASQMTNLSDLVASKSRETAKTTGRLITSIEEQRLAVPVEGEQRTFEPEKGRGHER